MAKLDRVLDQKGHDFLSPIEVDEVGPPPMPTSMYIGPVATVAISLSAEEIADQFHDVLEAELREQFHESEARGSAVDGESNHEETGSQGSLPLEG